MEGMGIGSLAADYGFVKLQDPKKQKEISTMISWAGMLEMQIEKAHTEADKIRKGQIITPNIMRSWEHTLKQLITLWGEHVPYIPTDAEIKEIFAERADIAAVERGCAKLRHLQARMKKCLDPRISPENLVIGKAVSISK